MKFFWCIIGKSIYQGKLLKFWLIVFVLCIWFCHILRLSWWIPPKWSFGGPWNEIANIHRGRIDIHILTWFVQDDKVRVVQTLLFVEGINTLLQTLFGTRLPTVVGGSYAFMVPVISIIRDPSFATIEDPHLVSAFSVISLSRFVLNSIVMLKVHINITTYEWCKHMNI